MTPSFDVFLLLFKMPSCCYQDSALLVFVLASAHTARSLGAELMACPVINFFIPQIHPARCILA
jgi:hypothetical protein